MKPDADQDWNPGAYGRFRGLRLRPALDLLAQVPDLPAGDVVDLGCGSGAAGPALRARFPGRRLIGLDASPAMLEAARQVSYDRLLEADIATWRAEVPPALIFSNAALHWLDEHATLLPALAGQLVPGGVLAVQMPGNFLAPSHALLREIAAGFCPEMQPQRPYLPPVLDVAEYCRMLAPLGMVEGWETTYCHRLAPSDGSAHPVRSFTQSTAMRPFLTRLEETGAEAFTRDYDAALDLAYPREADGSVLFPFRRVFVLFERG